MDPTEKGWLLKYLELRSQTEIFPWTKEIEFYNYLKNTGLMYGHPLNLPSEIKIDSSKFPVKERMKVIFTESLVSSVFTFIDKHSMPETDMEKVEKLIAEFYNLNTEKSKSYELGELLKFNSKTTKSAEKWLNNRISIKSRWNLQFWNVFFYNVLLYADTLQFIDWLKNSESVTYSFAEEKRKLRLTALQIIAAASNCNQVMDKEEERFYRFFLESSELEKTDLATAEKYLHSVKAVEQIEISSDASWLKRKYFLDLAILSLWADKTIAEAEMKFLKNLCLTLKLDEDELNGSLVAIESFVLQNWEKIHFLQSKQPYYVLSQRLVERLSSISLKYKNQLANEISESKDLVELLSKSTHSDLSIEEKERMRLQLTDILKSLPAVAYMCLPFTFFTLPVLFKIIPKSVFPSSFDENRLMHRKNRKIVE